MRAVRGPVGTALVGTALGGTALGGTALGGTAARRRTHTLAAVR
ncbi:hypothetical protein [Rhodococcus aetherivorans]|nr:hypothetical protein [Rhodococcus aetherivorans]